MGDWAFLTLFKAGVAPPALDDLGDDLEFERMLGDGWRLRRYSDPTLAKDTRFLLTSLYAQTGHPTCTVLIVDGDEIDLNAKSAVGSFRCVLPFPNPQPAELQESFAAEPLPAGAQIGPQAAALIAEWATAAGLTFDLSDLRDLCTERDDRIFAGGRALERLLDVLGLNRDR